MHPIVLDILPVQSTLVREILPELFVNIRRAHAPTILAIDSVTESGSVHDGQPQPDAFFLDVHRLALHPGRLLDALVCIGHGASTVKVAQEQAVDHGRLAESRLADDHQCELKAALHRLSVNLLGQSGEADVVAIAIKAAADAWREDRDNYVYVLSIILALSNLMGNKKSF